MSKQKEILIERRSRKLKGMDLIISATDDKELIRAWDCYINGQAFTVIAQNEQLYRACCQFFDRIDRDVMW